MIAADRIRPAGRVPVLVADDDAITIGLLSQMLGKAGYDVLTARNGREAMEVFRRQQVHMLITDWMMPEVSGPELCRWIRSQATGRYVFIIMLTSADEEEKVVEALDAGADEFIRKPIRAAELWARMGSAQRLLNLVSREAIVYALAELADSRDPETREHLDRIRTYCKILAQEVVARELSGDMSAGFADLLFNASPLHDIGKVGIPDAILLKPGQLSSAEFEIMKTHTTIGARALDRALTKFPAMQYLRTARDIALTHHERLDGSGYPSGLQGTDIPLAGRVVAVCDTYDAITSKRVYKSAKPHHIARAEIMRASGSHFDSKIVECFLAVESAFMEVCSRNGEEQEAIAGVPGRTQE
jgi:putative two-component system response regulator